jgi:hypothetical protein
MGLPERVRRPFVYIISAFKGIAARISKVHPLLFLAAYALAIPSFALTYEYIPRGFYAPYAHLEQTGQLDAYRIGVLIQSVLRENSLSPRFRSKESSSNYAIRNNFIYVQRLSPRDDSTISFDVLVLVRDKKRGGDAEFPIPVVMHAASRIVIYDSQTSQRHLRYVEQDNVAAYPAGMQEMMNDTFYELFRPTDDITEGSTIEVSIAQDDEIARYFDGLKGDPLSISGAYSRMLYFSTIVITTVGFGDIVPMTPLARDVVGVEAIFGVLLVGLFLNAVAYRAARPKGQF